MELEGRNHVYRIPFLITAPTVPSFIEIDGRSHFYLTSRLSEHADDVDCTISLWN